jgi:hypothetical protein
MLLASWRIQNVDHQFAFIIMSTKYAIECAPSNVPLPSQYLKYFGTFQCMVQEDICIFNVPPVVADTSLISKMLQLVETYDTSTGSPNPIYDRTDFGKVVDLTTSGNISLSGFPEALQTKANALTLSDVNRLMTLANWADCPLIIDYCYNVAAIKLLTATQPEIDQFVGVDSDWTEDETALISSLLANAADIKRTQMLS